MQNLRPSKSYIWKVFTTDSGYECNDWHSKGFPAVSEWAKGALGGMAKGAPFSLSVTKHHYAAVAHAAKSPATDLAEVHKLHPFWFKYFQV